MPAQQIRAIALFMAFPKVAFEGTCDGIPQAILRATPCSTFGYFPPNAAGTAALMIVLS